MAVSDMYDKILNAVSSYYVSHRIQKKNDHKRRHGNFKFASSPYDVHHIKNGRFANLISGHWVSLGIELVAAIKSENVLTSSNENVTLTQLCLN